MFDQAERLRELSKQAITVNKNPQNLKPNYQPRVIAVTSGKGGVGKSSFTVNLALALANYEKKVLIIDADLGMANIDVMLGCSAKYNMLHIIEGTHTFEEVLVTGPRNIKFLHGGSGIKTLTTLSNMQLQRVINNILNYEEKIDYVLLDTGAGMGENVISFLLAADDIILVTTPEPTSLTDAYAIVKTYANNSGNAPIRLIVNRADGIKEGNIVSEKLGKTISHFLKVNLQNLGYIYEDVCVSSSIKTQNPLLLQFPESPAAKCIINIAHKIAFGSEKIETNGFSGFLKKFLEKQNFIKFKKVGK